MDLYRRCRGRSTYICIYTRLNCARGPRNEPPINHDQPRRFFRRWPGRGPEPPCGRPAAAPVTVRGNTRGILEFTRARAIKSAGAPLTLWGARRVSWFQFQKGSCRRGDGNAFYGAPPPFPFPLSTIDRRIFDGSLFFLFVSFFFFLRAKSLAIYKIGALRV